MADRPLTEDEHTTRAMLLGMVYDMDANVYEPEGWENVASWDGLIDADTMEPVLVTNFDEWTTWCREHWPHLVNRWSDD